MERTSTLKVNSHCATSENTVVEQILLLSMNDTMFKNGIIDETERDKIKRLINKDFPISHSF